MIYQTYALIDPIDEQIKYVGSTRTTLGDRLSNHLSQSCLIPETELAIWINGLRKQKLKPKIFMLDTSHSREREKYWIRRLQPVFNINWKSAR